MNFHTAPLEAREAICLDEARRQTILDRLRVVGDDIEAMVLSTCNRTEIYVHCPDDCNPQLLVEKALFDVASTSLIVWRQQRQVWEGIAAVEHLFRLAAGLESQMLGENQIVHQLKEAYKLSIKADTSRFFFHKLLHAAFRVSKAVRSETAITTGAVSLALAAVQAIRTRLDLTGANILLVGAGQNASIIAKYLQKENLGMLTVASRTLQSAAALAGQLRNAVATTLKQISDVLTSADVAIFSTASSLPVLTISQARYYLAQRRKPLLIVDLAVPRDVDPKVARLPNVELVNIEQLHLQVEQNRAARAAWIEPAQKIIHQHIQQFIQDLSQKQTPYHLIESIINADNTPVAGSISSVDKKVSK